MKKKYSFNENEIADIFKEILNQKNELVTSVKWEFFPRLGQGDSDTHLMSLETEPITQDMRNEWQKQTELCDKAIRDLMASVKIEWNKL